jgi:hypothetical protein
MLLNSENAANILSVRGSRSLCLIGATAYFPIAVDARPIDNEQTRVQVDMFSQVMWNRGSRPKTSRAAYNMPPRPVHYSVSDKRPFVIRSFTS